MTIPIGILGFTHSHVGTCCRLWRDDVQAVVIGAETAYHADLVEQAAAAGKAIVLQKPLAAFLRGEGPPIVTARERRRVNLADASYRT